MDQYAFVRSILARYTVLVPRLRPRRRAIHRPSPSSRGSRKRGGLRLSAACTSLGLSSSRHFSAVFGLRKAVVVALLLVRRTPWSSP